MQYFKFIGSIVGLFSLVFGIYMANSEKSYLTPDETINYTKQLVKYSHVFQDSSEQEATTVALDTSQYPAVKTRIEAQRETWANANMLPIASDSISYLLGDSLAPYWIGTPWDYNGVSKKPQSGLIACGYFVYGLLEDAGFYLPRIKLSQATSEKSIKAIVSESHIKRFSNKEIDDFIASMLAWGEGIYLVGLDYHIALLQVKGTEVQMIHSSVYPPMSVVIEDAATSMALIHTQYRIVGKLNNETTMKKWLNGSYFSLN